MPPFPTFETCLPNRSGLALFLAKLSYLEGLRPSYGDLLIGFLVVRMRPGPVLLPGLVVLFVRAKTWEKWLVAVYLVPVLSGALQNRYLLPIAPIVFYYGAVFIDSVFFRRPTTGEAPHVEAWYTPS